MPVPNNKNLSVRLSSVVRVNLYMIPIRKRPERESLIGIDTVDPEQRILRQRRPSLDVHHPEGLAQHDASMPRHEHLQTTHGGISTSTVYVASRSRGKKKKRKE